MCYWKGLNPSVHQHTLPVPPRPRSSIHPPTKHNTTHRTLTTTISSSTSTSLPIPFPLSDVFTALFLLLALCLPWNNPRIGVFDGFGANEVSNLDTSLTWGVLPLLACLAVLALAWEVGIML